MGTFRINIPKKEIAEEVTMGKNEGKTEEDIKKEMAEAEKEEVETPTPPTE